MWSCLDAMILLEEEGEEGGGLGRRETKEVAEVWVKKMDDGVDCLGGRRDRRRDGIERVERSLSSATMIIETGSERPKHAPFSCPWVKRQEPCADGKQCLEL